jgi:GNAT superfamily N-acetyltransferase
MTRPPEPVALDPRARELSAREHEAVMRANFTAADYGDDFFPGLTEQLVAAQRACLAGTESRRFGAGEGGGLQAMGHLFLDPDVHGARMAMVEEVGTLPSHRERGLAKAVVCAAIDAGLRWGAELIAIPADADDWPQMIYAGLGFAPVGRQVHFTLRHLAS